MFLDSDNPWVATGIMYYARVVENLLDFFRMALDEGLVGEERGKHIVFQRKKFHGGVAHTIYGILVGKVNSFGVKS